jgi:hypothetical protein
MVVAGIPAGATIVRAYLLQVGGYAAGNNLGNVPTTANTTFGGTAFSGLVTGMGDFMTRWDNPRYGGDNNHCWNPGAVNRRFDVTSRVAAVGNGSYAVVQQAGGAEMTPTSTLIVVYQDPAVTDTGVVAIADGMFYWHPKAHDASPDSINDGNHPMPTTMDWSCAPAICDPSTARFTRIGATNALSAVQSYSDQLLPPGTAATLATYPAPRWSSAMGVLAQRPDLDTYVNPAGGFVAGDTSLTWNLGIYSDSKSTFWVNDLVKVASAVLLVGQLCEKTKPFTQNVLLLSE